MLQLSRRISRFAMLTEIQTIDFMLFAYPQAHSPIKNLQYDKGYDKGINPDGNDAECLNPEQRRIAKE